MEEKKSLIDQINALRDLGALTEAEYKLEMSKILFDENILGSQTISEIKPRKLDKDEAVVSADKSNRVRIILIAIGAFLILITTFLILPNHYNSAETHSGELISISGLDGLKIDNSSSLDVVLKNFGIPGIQPGVTFLTNDSNSPDELFASTFEFVPICNGVLSLTGLLGSEIKSQPVVIFNQKNGNYSSVVTDPQPGFSYSVSVIDDSSITQKNFSKMIKTVPDSCQWNNRIISPTQESLTSCAIDKSPWIDEACLLSENANISPPGYLFSTEYKTDVGSQWLKAVTQLVSGTTDDFKTTTIRKLMRISGSFHGIVEISIEIRSNKSYDTQLALKLATETVFDEFEKVALNAIVGDQGKLNADAVRQSSTSTTTWASIAPTSVSQQVGSTCVNQWDKAHAESMAGGSSDTELRQTVFSCTSVSEWKREANRVGEFVPYLLDSICVLVSNAPSTFCP